MTSCPNCLLFRRLRAASSARPGVSPSRADARLDPRNHEPPLTLSPTVSAPGLGLRQRTHLGTHEDESLTVRRSSPSRFARTMRSTSCEPKLLRPSRHVNRGYAGRPVDGRSRREEKQSDRNRQPAVGGRTVERLRGSLEQRSITVVSTRRVARCCVRPCEFGAYVSDRAVDVVDRDPGWPPTALG
jgi:hypothetical protein